MRLHGIGLGATCGAPVLSPGDLYNLAVSVGFDPNTATTMAAVAMRESGGCPTAHNPGPGEDSYGLWQINVQGNPGILSALGLSDPTDLYDPTTNAQAAFTVYAGNPANLNTAWYINRPGYQQAYQQYIPLVQAAITDQSTGQTVSGDTLPVSASVLSPSNPGTLMVLGIATLAGIFLLSK